MVGSSEEVLSQLKRDIVIYGDDREREARRDLAYLFDKEVFVEKK